MNLALWLGHYISLMITHVRELRCNKFRFSMSMIILLYSVYITLRFSPFFFFHCLIAYYAFMYRLRVYDMRMLERKLFSNRNGVRL